MASVLSSQKLWLRSRHPGVHSAMISASLYRRYSSITAHEASLDGRARLSRLWVPTGGIAASSTGDSHAKLIRAGFLRQAHPGIFHMLPLGRRVQDKLEALIDKHMFQLGASKLALSSISSEELWAKSGRLTNASSELFHFSDRKDAKYLLSPTHEEEITTLVSSTVKSYKELPVRLYQISRKYRDELRPRHGLLRSREFIMKDLYTFDCTSSLALITYHQVREVYSRIFDELKLPYLVAEADSGDMGGNLSHEFHFPTSKGEDHIISCSTCDYVANEELAESAVDQRHDDVTDNEPSQALTDVMVWRGISRDRLSLINVWYKSSSSLADSSSDCHEINMHAIKAILPDFDPSIDDPLPLWVRSLQPVTAQEVPTLPRPQRLVNLVDSGLSSHVRQSIGSQGSPLPIFPDALGELLQGVKIEFVDKDPSTQHPLNLLRIRDGDHCPRCPNGSLQVQRAIELGHTFHLGTRYSEPLAATVAAPIGREPRGTKADPRAGLQRVTEQIPMQMGCHGIGVSRIIGAVADTLADDKGLNWPRVMAPFEVLVVPSKGNDDAAIAVYDILHEDSSSTKFSPLDLVLDDRSQTFSWKMHDADLVGYPVIVVVGRRWESEQICEVQCRRLRSRQEVPISEIAVHIGSLLSQL
ncbi:prolyl-tRNA synthetase-like protein [Rhexocercosporidium sp. MPI-PUGE-AT-0058]|nr:prolyl-tRNA synthetase-like protein [Rhexocercosporidium sp. MPI-PUGE-AT-0058]